jgi:hypothetical protein
MVEIKVFSTNDIKTNWNADAKIKFKQSTQTIYKKLHKDLNVSSKTIKLLEEIRSLNLHELEFSNGFLDLKQKHKQQMKN